MSEKSFQIQTNRNINKLNPVSVKLETQRSSKPHKFFILPAGGMQITIPDVGQESVDFYTGGTSSCSKTSSDFINTENISDNITQNFNVTAERNGHLSKKTKLPFGLELMVGPGSYDKEKICKKAAPPPSQSLLASAAYLKSYFISDKKEKKLEDDFENEETVKNKVMGMWHNLKYGWTSNLKTNFSRETPVYLLGKVYHKTFHEEEIYDYDGFLCSNMVDFKHDFSKFAWFTYRRKFAPLANGLTTDCGWGCTIRSGQMMLMTALSRHFLPRENGHKTKINVPEYDLVRSKLLRLFCDDPTLMSPFSIHNLIEAGYKMNKKAGQWFGPSGVAYMIKDRFENGSKHVPSLGRIAVYVAQDGAIYIQDVLDLCSTKRCICSSHKNLNDDSNSNILKEVDDLESMEMSADIKITPKGTNDKIFEDSNASLRNKFEYCDTATQVNCDASLNCTTKSNASYYSKAKEVLNELLSEDVNQIKRCSSSEDLSSSLKTWDFVKSDTCLPVSQSFENLDILRDEKFVHVSNCDDNKKGFNCQNDRGKNESFTEKGVFLTKSFDSQLKNDICSNGLETNNIKKLSDFGCQSFVENHFSDSVIAEYDSVPSVNIDYFVDCITLKHSLSDRKPSVIKNLVNNIDYSSKYPVSDNFKSRDSHNKEFKGAIIGNKNKVQSNEAVNKYYPKISDVSLNTNNLHSEDSGVWINDINTLKSNAGKVDSLLLTSQYEVVNESEIFEPKQRNLHENKPLESANLAQMSNQNYKISSQNFNEKSSHLTENEPPVCRTCNNWKSCIIFIPVRLGGACLNSIYNNCLFSLFLHDLCIGVVGGKPKHSLYFVGFQDNHLIHLDPHLCQDAIPLNANPYPQESYVCKSPRKISISKIDPSACIGFYCQTKDQFLRLVKEATVIANSNEGNLVSPIFEFLNGRNKDISGKFENTSNSEMEFEVIETRSNSTTFDQFSLGESFCVDYE